MNPLTQSKNTTILPVLIALTLGCFALSPQARAVEPAPDGGYPNQNTAEDDDARFSLTTGTDNTAMGFDALCNTTGSDNALASWVWRATGSLNTARAHHTATLLPNGMVLVAAGQGNRGALARAELYDPASGTWTATGSLNTARYCTRRPCCQTARSLLQGDLITISGLPRARNCTTRRAGPGLPQAASTPHTLLTRRRCYQTPSWSLLQVDLQTAVLCPGRNWDAVAAKIHWTDQRSDLLAA